MILRLLDIKPNKNFLIKISRQIYAEIKYIIFVSQKLGYLKLKNEIKFF